MNNVNNPTLTLNVSVSDFTIQEDVSASRASDGTVYQNTSSHAKLVAVSVQLTPANGMNCYTDSNVVPTTIVAVAQNINIANATSAVTFLVLPGNYYKVASGGNLQKWVEWR